MTATVKKYGKRFEVIGLDFLKEINGLPIYEMRYLYTFGGKTYATEKNAIRAIAKAGFEYVATTENQLMCAYD